MATTAAAAGAVVWVQDAQRGWAKGTVAEVQGNSLVVALDDGQRINCDVADGHVHNTELVEDMTNLAFLHEPGVLWNLQARYAQRQVYTYTGSILIAVNPFQPLPQLYGPDIIETYASAARPQDAGAPHVYATACAAYHNMIRDNAGQAILVTGESGAGKTETAKLIMTCLAQLGARNKQGHSVDSSTPTMTGVEQKILESNPLLEAFGNAKTVRNNNSSRFGKYVEIFFDPGSGSITGGAVRTYLLERSRVVHCSQAERSFHIFYQLVYGASGAEREEWHLPEDASSFAYLAQSSCFELPGQSNADEYQHTRLAMEHVGISEEQQLAVLRVVSAVLHLGNITFRDATGQGDGRQEGAAVVGEPAQQALAWAAELLGVDADQLRAAVTTRLITTPEGTIATPLNAQAASDARDSMAKVLYARLFDWLVAAINAAVDEAHNGPSSPNAGRRQTPCKQHLSIGLLDIYGFESFASNDLEQLCINLTNEKLQQHFNSHVFKWEQAEYEREGVDWSYISFRDNADVLELLEGKMGLLDLLDEACRFPKSTAEDLLTKYCSSSLVSGSSRFTRLKRPATAFSVEHYAGSVPYDTTNFLDKNKDYVVAEHQAVLSRSAHALVAALFAPEQADAASTSGTGPLQPASGRLNSNAGSAGPGPGSGPSKSQYQFRSVGLQCRRQLSELMGTLSTLQPHYVRCIKPNQASAAGVFDAAYSLQQLKCGGVMEAVRISCAGFAYKRPYAAFLEHFWQLCPAARQSLQRLQQQSASDSGSMPNRSDDGRFASSSGSDSALRTSEKEAARMVLQAAGLGDVAHFGHTKLFLRSPHAAALERMRVARVHTAAALIQAHMRRRMVQQWYMVMRWAIQTIQACARGMIARRLVHEMRRERAACTIQACWRGCEDRLRFQRMRRSAVTVQAAWRGFCVRRRLEELRRERAALVLQCAWRGAVVRKEYLDVVRTWRAAVRIQAAWRCFDLRRWYLQVLPMHRAAFTIQRVWRSHRRGARLAERVRAALLQYWLWTKAAVVVQAYWRGKMARQLARKLRHQQRMKRLLSVFGDAGPAAGASGRRDMPTARPSPSTLLRPSTRRITACNSQAGCVPADGEVVRSEVVACPDRDSRMRARLDGLQNVRVRPLLEMWEHKAQEDGQVGGTHAPWQTPHGAHPIRPSPARSWHAGHGDSGFASTRPSTATDTDSHCGGAGIEQDAAGAGGLQRGASSSVAVSEWDAPLSAEHSGDSGTAACQVGATLPGAFSGDANGALQPASASPCMSTSSLDHHGHMGAQRNEQLILKAHAAGDLAAVEMLSNGGGSAAAHVKRAGVLVQA